jgi:hypothetical protein
MDLCVYGLRQLLITQNYKFTCCLSLQLTSGQASLSQMSWKLAVISARCVRTWCTAMRRQELPCIVFSEHRSWDAVMDEDTCDQCGWEALDGSKHFLLRKASFSSNKPREFELCFHYDLLYKTLQELAGGQHWHNKWMRQMHAYRQYGMSVAHVWPFRLSTGTSGRPA